jgi:acyl-coenzyme A synthetase/AMP-(fatty) acid ligase
VHELLPRNPFTPDGLLTGDLGRFDDRGRLHVTGRRDDVINVHGEKVDPGEVEDVLRSHAAVRDAAVVGIPTTIGDQWMAAFVVCDDTRRRPRAHHPLCRHPGRVQGAAPGDPVARAARAPHSGRSAGPRW